MKLKWVCYGKFFSAGEVAFIHLNQVNKTCPSTLIWASYQSLLLQYLMGVMESIYTELALNAIKKECARTDNVIFLISEICDNTAYKLISKNKYFFWRINNKDILYSFTNTCWIKGHLVSFWSCNNSMVYGLLPGFCGTFLVFSLVRPLESLPCNIYL